MPQQCQFDYNNSHRLDGDRSAAEGPSVAVCCHKPRFPIVDMGRVIWNVLVAHDSRVEDRPTSIGWVKSVDPAVLGTAG